MLVQIGQALCMLCLDKMVQDWNLFIGQQHLSQIILEKTKRFFPWKHIHCLQIVALNLIFQFHN